MSSCLVSACRQTGVAPLERVPRAGSKKHAATSQAPLDVPACDVKDCGKIVHSYSKRTVQRQNSSRSPLLLRLAQMLGKSCWSISIVPHANFLFDND